MKIISLWQPWASLMALNLKQNETRSWSTTYRGPLGIHATKTIVPFEKIFIDLEIQKYCFLFMKLRETYGDYENLPTGAIIAVGNLHDVVAVEKVIPELTWLERACGDYSLGRFAWKLKDTVRLKEPIPVKGHQRLWDFNLEGALQDG